MIEIVTIEINKDYSRAESSGASGKFQVSDITGINEYGKRYYDLAEKLESGKFYDDNYEVLDDLKNVYVSQYHFDNCNIEEV